MRGFAGRGVSLLVERGGGAWVGVGGREGGTFLEPEIRGIEIIDVEMVLGLRLEALTSVPTIPHFYQSFCTILNRSPRTLRVWRICGDRKKSGEEGGRGNSPSHVLQHKLKTEMIEQDIQIPRIQMHLEAPRQQLRKYLIRRRGDVFLTLHVKDRTIAILKRLIGCMNRLLHARLIQPIGTLQHAWVLLACVLDVVGGETFAAGFEEIDGGGVGCATLKAGGGDRGVD